MSFEKINLRKKFLLLSSIIIVAFAFILSGIYYAYMKKIVVQDALEKSQLILQEVEAIRSYVIQELRPKMYELHGNESFILEAMSTTYVSIRIMRLFQERMEGYTYRRVSQNPRNPENATNEWEDKMFDWFGADKSRLFWQGQVESDAASSFISVIPDYMEKECLSCHGDAKDAPAPMVSKYGDFGGFRFSEGDLAGLNSVSIPIAKPLARLKALTGVLFLLTLVSSLLLLLIVNVLFDKLVVSRLAWVIDSLQENNKNFNTPPQDLQDAQAQKDGKITRKTTADELDSLQASFRQLNRYVRTARRGDNVQPNFVGPYTIANPIATGVMSWLYQGFHSETKKEVLLKIPLNNLYVNPLYRACLQTELKIIQNCDHRNLIKVKERINDILILDTLRGPGVMNSKGNYDVASIRMIFSQIFDMVAYLHTSEIVHHDLRPDNFFITKEFSPVLVDLGLAHSRKLPDTIFDSGMGPQGDFRFMAPEQINGLRGDPRSDLYSLGVLLFNIHTGSFPHTSKPRSKQEWLKIKEQIARTVAQHEQLPTVELGRIIAKALAHDTRARYQWVEDMRDDFLALSH
ncbi:MAG: DUF3365 domain-containing protein [Desulfobulbaceae bacterium]|nr:DUF3365 domain-containing protein [Desulfobulbaceae bacterium]